jgi:hypothetical protein
MVRETSVRKNIKRPCAQVLPVIGDYSLRLKVRKIKFNFLNAIVSLNGIPEVRGMSPAIVRS